MAEEANKNFYSFTAKHLDTEEDAPMSAYEGKVSGGLSGNLPLDSAQAERSVVEIYKEKGYKEKGLEIVAFPCNQFGKQEPGTKEEIRAFVDDYGVTFPMMSKIDVNGKQEDPLYTWMKSKQGGFLGSKIKWNFSKFVINKKGECVSRHSPMTNPNSLIAEVDKLLAEE